MENNYHPCAASVFTIDEAEKKCAKRISFYWTHHFSPLNGSIISQCWIFHAFFFFFWNRFLGKDEIEGDLSGKSPNVSMCEYIYFSLTIGFSAIQWGSPGWKVKCVYVDGACSNFMGFIQIFHYGFWSHYWSGYIVDTEHHQLTRYIIFKRHSSVGRWVEIPFFWLALLKDTHLRGRTWRRAKFFCFCGWWVYWKKTLPSVGVFTIKIYMSWKTDRNLILFAPSTWFLRAFLYSPYGAHSTHLREIHLSTHLFLTVDT